MFECDSRVNVMELQAFHAVFSMHEIFFCSPFVKMYAILDLYVLAFAICDEPRKKERKNNKSATEHIIEKQNI